MTENELVLLHHRSALGELLTAEEHTALNAWYARNNAEEAELLSKAAEFNSNDELRAQLSAAMSQLAEVIRHIQETMAANERIRKDIAALQEQLAQRISERAA